MNHGIRSVSNVVDSTQPVMNGHPNECNIKVENWLMIFIVHAWHTAPLKRHFASAFNCFVCKYLQIGDGPKFCGRIEEESTFELTISLSVLDSITLYHSWYCDFHDAFVWFITEMLIQIFTQFNYSALESIPACIWLNMVALTCDGKCFTLKTLEQHYYLLALKLCTESGHWN